MQAVADALSLLANFVMAWNTAPTRVEGINVHGVLRFPLEPTLARSCRHKRQLMMSVPRRSSNLKSELAPMARDT